MKDERKTKQELIDELNGLRRQLEKMKPAVPKNSRAKAAADSSEEKFKSVLGFSFMRTYVSVRGK